MKVELLHHTPLEICVEAIRTCHESFGNSDDMGPKDCALVTRVGNQMKHSSTLEHLNYNFRLQDFSRALLQELARHRIASISVKSTRYTLKELENEEPFIDYYSHTDTPENIDIDRVAKYCVLTENDEINNIIAIALENLRWLKAQKVPNDIAKFAIPDAYKTRCIWTINARSLQNFLSLRTPPTAMWEIRKLAYAIYEALPKEHRYIFEEFVYQEPKPAVYY